MYKVGSFESELMRSMEKELISNNVEQQYNFNKLAKAVDFIHTAASIFEDAGLQDAADSLTSILQDLSNKLNSK